MSGSSTSSDPKRPKRPWTTARTAIEAQLKGVGDGRSLFVA